MPLPGSWQEGRSLPIVPCLARKSGDISRDTTSGYVTPPGPGEGPESGLPGFSPHPVGQDPEPLVTSQVGGVHQSRKLVFLLPPTPHSDLGLGCETLSGERGVPSDAVG